MARTNINPKILLSTLWVFTLFNMVLRDLHEFPTEGYIEDMMALRLSDQTMLLYGFVVEIPILMILLSRLLPPKANQWANIIAAGITMLGIISTLPAGDLDDFFFATMNSIALIIVMITAWQLPSLKRERLTYGKG